MSERKLFGTDGIRGEANVYPMTCEVAMMLGRAVTHYFQATTNRENPLIIVGKDTRLSCYMIEQAFSAGVLSQGGRVILTGPLPTPGVAYVTESMRANAGVMISASHNHFADNGIKIFDQHGHKLPDSVELELEKMILNPDLVPLKKGAELGQAKRLEEVVGRYIVSVKNTFPTELDLSDMRIVLDSANGAAYKVAPLIFSELGAEVIGFGNTPNGININDHCGALHPKEAAKAVKTYRADLGICLDGDADRIVIIDNEGYIVEGDHLIGVFAKYLLETKVLKKGDVVVGTLMSNLGLEHFVESLGLKFIRAKVGDRYIMEELKKNDGILGGEPSGHIIFRNVAKTGDGVVAGLKAIECIKYYKKTFSELIGEIKLYPQELINVKVKKKVPFDKLPILQETLKKAEDALDGKGRILLRYSGTENLARVMVEGQDESLVKEWCKKLSKTLSSELSKE